MSKRQCQICKAWGHYSKFHNAEIRQKMADIAKDIPLLQLENYIDGLEEIALISILEYYEDINTRDRDPLPPGKYWN